MVNGPMIALKEEPRTHPYDTSNRAKSLCAVKEEAKNFLQKKAKRWTLIYIKYDIHGKRKGKGKNATTGIVAPVHDAVCTVRMGWRKIHVAREPRTY